MTPGIAPPESLLRSGLTSLALSGWSLLLGFLSVPLLISSLGLVAYGAYSIAFVVAGYGSLLELGLGWAGIRFIAEAHARRDESRLRATCCILIIYQTTIAVIVVGVTAIWPDRIGAWLTPFAANEAALIATILPVAGCWFAVSGYAVLFGGVLRGMQRFTAATILGSLTTTVCVGGAMAVVLAGGGVAAVAVMQLIGALIGAIGGAWLLRNDVFRELPLTSADLVRQVLSDLLKFSTWSLGARILQVVVLQGDKIIATRMTGAAGLPSYTVPFNLAQRLNLVGSVAANAVYPVAAARTVNLDEFHDTYFRASRAVHLTTAGPAIALIVTAHGFLASWVGVEMADRGAQYLQALTVGYWVVSVGSLEAGCLDGRGEAHLTFLAAAAGFIGGCGMGVAMAMVGNSLSAVVSGVTTWLIVTGGVQIVTWQRYCGFAWRRFAFNVAMPVAEMFALALMLRMIVIPALPHGMLMLAATAALAGVITMYGSARMFSGAERRQIFARFMVRRA